jgi:SAM-dependent methyltransferase
MQTSFIAQFDSSTPEYAKAFHTFLAHTDQKKKALDWLEREVAGLGRLERAIDAGAGTGKLTAWLADRFASVIGVEPNPSLAAEFRTACPKATLLTDTILAANPRTAADFILCSHVLYYIPRTDWEANLRKMMGWLASGGVLAIALQSPDTDCMKMIDHFIGGRFPLRELAAVAASSPEASYDVRLDTVEAFIRTEDLQTACEIAVFILNLLPMPNPPTWSDVEHYVAARFSRAGGGFESSCHQDFLRIARRL